MGILLAGGELKLYAEDRVSCPFLSLRAAWPPKLNSSSSNGKQKDSVVVGLILSAGCCWLRGGGSASLSVVSPIEIHQYHLDDTERVRSEDH